MICKIKDWNMSRHLSVWSIIGKMVLYILFFAVLWMIIRWFWLSYDWFPMVKNEIPGIFIPIGLSVLMLLLFWHEISSANDRWENLIGCLIMLSSVIVFINAGFIAEDATARMVSVDRLTDL